MKARKIISLILALTLLSVPALAAKCTPRIRCASVRYNYCSNSTAQAGASGEAPAETVAPADNISSLAGEVIRQTNMERAGAGLGSLKVSSALTKAACVRAAEIVEKFSHTRPDGSKWNTVSSQAYGENIAKGHNSVDRVMAAWMSSSGHRQNILRASYASIGVCAYKVNGIYYWVQLFGR